MNTDDISIAVYDSHVEAEQAIKRLQSGGLDMRKLSIIGREYQTEQHVLGYLNTGERVKWFGKWGLVWGGLAGVLLGSAFMVIPVFGTLVVLGPLASIIVGGVEGAIAGGGVSTLAAVLMSIGIPKDSIVHYETALKARKYLLIVHGSAADLALGREILRNSAPGTDAAAG
jgi:hypothetical protein